MRSGFVNGARWLIYPVAGTRRSPAIIEAPFEYVEIGRTQMGMRRVHLASFCLDEDMKKAGFLIDAQDFDLIADTIADPVEVIRPDKGGCQRIEVALGPRSGLLAVVLLRGRAQPVTSGSRSSWALCRPCYERPRGRR